MIKQEPLGKHIRLVDERNIDSITDRVLGISIDKYFMPSVANVIGTDLSKYKLIKKGYFACNPMHVGRDERLPVSLYTDNTYGIVSPAYFVFKIINPNILNADYLMMWMRRPEFDRQCWLHTDGSVRGGITWEDICRLKIPVPSILEQENVVKAYKIVEDRIILKRKINDNLAETANALFIKFFINNTNNVNYKTGFFVDLISRTVGGDWGQELPKGNYTEKVSCIRGTDIPALNMGSISEAPTRYILPQNLINKCIQANDMVIEISGGSPVQSTGRIALVPQQVLDYRKNKIICSNFCRVITVEPKYVYFFLQYWIFLYRNGRMFDYENSSTGLKNFDFSAFTETLEIVIPSDDILVQFNNMIAPIYAEIYRGGFEIETLKTLQSHILPHLMNHGI